MYVRKTAHGVRALYEARYACEKSVRLKNEVLALPVVKKQHG